MTNTNDKKNAAISDLFKKILHELDEDTDRPGLIDTPNRVAKSLAELTSGKHFTAQDVVGDGIFPCETTGMITQTDIEFYSLCEHHVLPFFGKVHVAYLPNQQIIGLSKIGRIVDIFSKRLQVQENLCFQIAHAINDIIKPRGVAVLIEADHFCMMMRGVKKQGALTTTQEFLGEFNNDSIHRNNFFELIRK